MTTTIPCPCGTLAREAPEQVAILDQYGSLNYAQFNKLIGKLAEKIKALDVQPNEPILVYGVNSRAIVALFFACLRAGVTFAPVSRYAPASQIIQFAEQIQAHHLIHTIPMPFSIEHPTLKLSKLLLTIPEKKSRSTPPLTNEQPVPMLDLMQHATILQTSGSTGRPKAALHLLQNHYYSAMGSNQNIPLQHKDRWLLSLPFWHVAGIAILMRCVLAGATIAIGSAEYGQGSENVRHSLLAYQPTHCSFVATQLSRLLKATQDVRKTLQQTKAILLGGSAIPKKLLCTAYEQKLPIHTSYGATEMASQITTTSPNASLDELETSGMLLPYRQLKLAEDNEILVAGETLFAGYIEQGILHQQTQKGWFQTGDLGMWDEKKRLCVTGRKDAMFISGGENIQPEEIEEALQQHEDVEQAIVVDIPDEEFGARPCAFVKMRAGKILQSNKMRSFLKGKLAKYKLPNRFYNWPKEVIADSKPNRSQLREIARRS